MRKENRKDEDSVEGQVLKFDGRPLRINTYEASIRIEARNLKLESMEIL